MRSATFAYMLLLAAPVLADTPAATPADDSATLGEIVVTGSHIRTVDIETQHPIFTLDRAAIERTGLTSVSDIVDLVVAGGESLNRNINNGGNGEQLVELRALGFEHTLVLLNGQRFVTDISGAVDLSSIPLALVEQIEVLLDGASAIYGSDAIAGVVNIITRRDYDGGEVGAYYGQNEHDDGARQTYTLTFGHKGDGWSVAGGIEYDRDEPIFARDRAISAVPVFGLPPGATGSTATPYTWLLPDSYDRTVRLIDGRSGASADDFRPVQNYVDRYNTAALNYLQTPQQRRDAFAQARYEFSATLAVHVDAIYTERRSIQQLAPSPLTLDVSDSGAADAIAISANNVYNPFGEPIDAVRRRFAEAGPRVQDQNANTQRLHAGLDGLLALGGRDFAWGFDAIVARSHERELAGPYADDSKLALALGPSFIDASGTPRCGTLNAITASCVPLNLFGPPGSITPAMLDYVAATETNRVRNESRGANLHVSSDRLADLPAGPLGFAAGLEYRRESGADLVDPLRASGNENGNGGTYDSTHGAYSVREVYVELDAPVVADRPFARRLDFVVGSRHSAYSNFGGTTNSQLGLRWRPLDSLLVRANLAQGFRAPSIQDLFQGAGRSLAPGLVDPCDPNNEPTPQILARCAALGVPTNVDSTAQFASVTSRGNQQLRPETARSRGVGFVAAPAWMAGFDFAVDWYRIRLRDAIGGGGNPQDIVDECYVFDFNAACPLIERNPGNGTLLHVANQPLNFTSGIETSGYDLALHYRRDTRIGRLRLDWNANYVDYIGEIGHPAAGTQLADGIAYGNTVGENIGGLFNAVWRWRSQLSLAWERAPWGASITARSFSSIRESCRSVALAASHVGDSSLLGLCSNPEPSLQLADQLVPSNRVSSVTYADLEGGWEAPWHARFALGVRNAFDRDPPLAYSAFANSFFPDYDVPGRFWYVRYRQTF